MRSAPSVSYPVGRSRLGEAQGSALRVWLYGMALVAGLLVCAAWALLSQAGQMMQGVVGLLCLAVTLVGVRALLRSAQGDLRWDGQGWRWMGEDGEVEGQVHVRLDWQRGMLLEFKALNQKKSLWHDRKSLWLWVEWGASPAYWNALRRAAWNEGAA